jgi:hypothetical protein
LARIRVGTARDELSSRPKDTHSCFYVAMIHPIEVEILFPNCAEIDCEGMLWEIQILEKHLPMIAFASKSASLDFIANNHDTAFPFAFDSDLSYI